jgi:HEAT repeat protein
MLALGPNIGFSLQLETFIGGVNAGCIILAVTAMAGFSGLIIYRSIRYREDLREVVRINELVDLGLEYLEKERDFAALKEQLKRRDRRLLLNALSNIASKVKGDYVKKVIKLMHALNAKEEGMKALQSSTWWRRVDACKFLGSVPGDEVVAALYEALDDSIIEVRVEAARALSRLGATCSPKLLLEKLANVTSTRSMVMADIFHLLDQKAVPELIEIIQTEDQGQVLGLVVDTLGHIGDLRAVNPLLDLNKRASAEIRVAIMKAFSLLLDSRVISAVRDNLKNASFEVRYAAAICAGKLGSIELVPDMKACLNDDKWWVRFRVAEALFELGIPGKEVLKKVATTGSGWAREIAGDVLKEKESCSD